MVTTAEAFATAFKLHGAGRLPEAETIYRQVLQAEPGHADATHLLGLVAHQTGRHDLAIELIARAIRLRGDRPLYYSNLGEVYRAVGKVDEAIGCLRQAVRLDPNCREAHTNLGALLMAIGQSSDAIAAFRQVVRLQPAPANLHSNLLYALNFDAAYDPPTIFAEHLAWAQRHAEPLTALALRHANDRTPGRRLRIGYVSEHFRFHAVNFFVEPILASHDHEQFEIFCYSDVRNDDAVTVRLKALADCWRNVRQMSDDQIAQQVRDDRIDILVDLAGHIAGNRLLVFARKPAPVQVTYLGYQNTTGMSAMDYRLTDATADPPGLTDAFYTERLIRLPRSFFCYRPPDAAPPITLLPALTAGHVTFGSFNNFSKVSQHVLQTWLRILHRLARSRLLVLAECAAHVRQQVHDLARTQGIEPSRIEVFDHCPNDQYLRLLQQADIALDPFPFTGHTTTCDSVWMGLPVVMLEGDRYASRFGGSVLANVCLDRLIASSVEQYSDLAVGLASDLERLAQLRSELRPRMSASPLLDFQGFTCNLEHAYRQMWLTWVAGAKSEQFTAD